MNINMVVAMKFEGEMPLCGISSALEGNKAYFVFDDIFFLLEILLIVVIIMKLKKLLKIQN